MKRVGQHILIIPEGWCEYNYAQALKHSLPKDKQRSIAVEMPKPNNENTACQLLDKAESMIRKAKRDKNPFDSVWIFFDNDNQPNLSGFFQRLNNSAVRIAYSSLCIEHWFIVHFEDNRQAYQKARQAVEKIGVLWQNQFNQPYHKTRINHFERLKDRLPSAMAIAENIEQQALVEHVTIAPRNPYFTLQEFIRFFQNL